MKVKVKYFGRVQEIVGKEEENFQLKNRRLKNLLKKILEKYGEFKIYYEAALNKNFVILVNGERVKNDKKLKNGDVIAFFPIIEGG